MTDTTRTIVIILGLTLVTVITRGIFLFPNRELPLPGWLVRGMRYTPLAALMAGIVPQVLMTNGHLMANWLDARLFATAAATLSFFFWRRDILRTILVGAFTMVGLRTGLGW